MKVNDFKKRYANIPKKYKGGDCYKRAINYMLAHREQRLLLCHGWVSGRGPIKGVRFSHAWVENLTTGECIDPSLHPQSPLVLPKFVFYSIGNVIEERVLKYDYSAMMEWIQKTSKAGPWEVKFDE